MDNELLNEIHMVKNHSDETRRIYKHAIDNYTKFCSMSLSELDDFIAIISSSNVSMKSVLFRFNVALNFLYVMSATSRLYFVFKSSLTSLLLIPFLQQLIISCSCCSKK